MSMENGRKTRRQSVKVCLRQHGAGWGQKLISTSSHIHRSFVSFHEAYLVVYSSKFILSYLSPSIVGIQPSLRAETNQAALPKDRSITGAAQRVLLR